MKKLMCAIAAVSAGICLADVSSANVVGYLNKEVTPNEWNLSCSTFQTVGDKVATLGDITANDLFAFAADTLQTLNGNGGTLANYTFLSANVAPDYAEYGLSEGWYDYDELMAWDWASEAPAKKNSVELPFGTMFILQSANDGAALVYSGEVLPTDKEFLIISGVWNMLGNATPVDLTLGDITANDIFAFAADTIQTLNGNGGTLANYTYLSPTFVPDYEMYGLKAGWYDYDDLMAWDWASEAPAQKNNVAIPAGYGFIVQSANDGASITIPSPLVVE